MWLPLVSSYGGGLVLIDPCCRCSQFRSGRDCVLGSVTAGGLEMAVNCLLFFVRWVVGAGFG